MSEILSGNRHSCGHLDSLNVLSLPALWPLGHVELYRLPFLQAAEASSLNSGEMHEDILPILTADEAVAFGIVKPLYCSLFHFEFLFPLLNCAEKNRSGEKGCRWLAVPIFNCG